MDATIMLVFYRLEIQRSTIKIDGQEKGCLLQETQQMSVRKITRLNPRYKKENK